MVARLVARLDGMPLAIELAAARVEALGVAQLLDRLDDRFALLAGGDRLAPARQRSLAATVEWSYQLLEEHERRVFRALSVFPGPFTLEAAEAVAGAGRGPGGAASGGLLAADPAAAGPGWPVPVCDAGDAARLRGRAAGRGRGAGRSAAAALAGYALRVARQAAAGLQSGDGELAAARWLDAEDATMRQALGWAGAHDPALALRLANALGWWWVLRGRLAGEYPLLLPGRRRRRGGQRRVVRRADLARLGSAGLGRSGRVRSAISPRSATPPRAGRRPGR